MRILLLLTAALSATGCGLESTPGNWRYETRENGNHLAISNQGGQKAWLQCPPLTLGIGRGMEIGTIQVDTHPKVRLNPEWISSFESHSTDPEGGLDTLIRQMQNGRKIRIRMRGTTRHGLRRETFIMHLKGFQEAWKQLEKACETPAIRSS